MRSKFIQFNFLFERIHSAQSSMLLIFGFGQQISSPNWINFGLRLPTYGWNACGSKNRFIPYSLMKKRSSQETRKDKKKPENDNFYVFLSHDILLMIKVLLKLSEIFAHVKFILNFLSVADASAPMTKENKIAQFIAEFRQHLTHNPVSWFEDAFS